MEETLEYYKFIRTSVQLENVRLISLNCSINEENPDNKNLTLDLGRAVKVVSDTEALLRLNTRVYFEGGGPFSIDVIYEGGASLTKDEIDRESFEKYSFDQVVPLLLPYARECVANVLARMGFPIYTIPTMDVLESMKQNSEAAE